jgi:fibronectin-binding autotransporter adhesin
MALTTYIKADNTTQLDQAPSWLAGVVPPSSTTSRTRWDNTITVVRSAALGTSKTWGQISITNPGGLCSIASSPGTLTLTPTDVDAANIGIDMSTATQNFTIASSVSLGSSQTWSVASGRTLTVSSIVSGTGFSLTKNGAGTLALLTGANNFGGVGSSFTASAGLTTVGANASLGSASNTVVVNSGAAMQITATAPQQTVWQASGAGTATSYGAIHTTGAFGATRTITMLAPDTVLSIRNGVVFTGVIALGSGVTSFTLNGENTSVSDVNIYTVTTQSNYGGAGTVVTLSSLGLDGAARAVKYSIGTAAGVSDLNTSGGGGLGNNANAITIATTGGIYSGSASGTFNRNYTFAARGARQTVGQFKYNNTGTTTFTTGTLTFSGGTSDYVQLHGANDAASIIRLNGTITGGANLDVGANGTNGIVDAALELGSSLVSTGWASTAALSVNHIRYGTGLANANPITFQQAQPSIIDAVASGVTARHSSYTNLSATTFTFTGTNDLTLTGPVAGSANWTGTTGTWNVNGSTLTLGFNFQNAGTLTKGGAGTLVLTGNNAAITAVAWNAGGLTLNSNGAAGSTGATFTITSTGVLDSTTGATLTQTGANSLNANFTWGGSGDLTFNPGNLSWSAARTVSFLNGKTGTLKFQGNAVTTTGSSTLSIGGSPVGGSRSRFWLGGTNASLSTGAAGQLLQVTAGYFRVSNSAGLGNAATTMWTVSSGAALEVDGGISPTSARNCTITGPGPNTDGALRSVSGTNVWNGSIVPPVQSLASPTRIQVDAGTFTLATGSYATIAPTTSGTPLQFTALGASAVLNQPRQLTNTVSDVTINNGGVGTVVLSVQNNHTGGTTVEGGTCKVTQVNATSTGTVQVNAAATLESTVLSQFTTLSLGSSPTTRAILKFAA